MHKGHQTYRIDQASAMFGKLSRMWKTMSIGYRNCNLKTRYLKAKRTKAPAYSRALRRIKGRVPKGGQEKLRSDFQRAMMEQSSC